jgi:hypothetical protein
MEKGIEQTTGRSTPIATPIFCLAPCLHSDTGVPCVVREYFGPLVHAHRAYAACMDRYMWRADPPAREETQRGADMNVNAMRTDMALNQTIQRFDANAKSGFA